MLTLLNAALKEFEGLRETASEHPSFILLYDSILKIAQLAEATDDERLNKTLQLIGWYELVARSTQITFLMQPYSLPNRFILSLAAKIAEKIQKPIYSILYARSMHWLGESPRWFNPITTETDLPTEHGEFAITETGDICLLEPLIDTAILLFAKEGHREMNEIWLSNDSRTYNQPLSSAFLLALCDHFPAFKVLYDKIALSCVSSPLGKLQTLRTGLRDGSVKGQSSMKGIEYDDGRASVIARHDFSIWWDDIKTVNYGSGKTLRQVLSELRSPHRDGRNLGVFLDIILPDQAVDLYGTASTCVQLRGDELQEIITINGQFLLSLEQPTPTQADLVLYQNEIMASFRHNEPPVYIDKKVKMSLHFDAEIHQLPYYPFCVTQLWNAFCRGNVSQSSLTELVALLQELSVTQAQQFWEYPMDFSHLDDASFKPLRDLCLLLEKKMEENILLFQAEQHMLTSREQALLTIFSYNKSLLTWAVCRYEFILFTNRSFVDLIINNGLNIHSDQKQFNATDLFDLASYVVKKTTNTVLDFGHFFLAA